MSKAQRYELQWDEQTHLLAERAARAAGHSSIKAYVTQLIRRDAPAVLENYSNIQLTNEQFDAFCLACDNPPTPGTRIKRAAEALDREGFDLSE